MVSVSDICFLSQEIYSSCSTYLLDFEAPIQKQISLGLTTQTLATNSLEGFDSKLRGRLCGDSFWLSHLGGRTHDGRKCHFAYSIDLKRCKGGGGVVGMLILILRVEGAKASILLPIVLVFLRVWKLDV